MIVFFTDPHLGLRRQAHTTPASLNALRERLYDAVENVYQTYKSAKFVCLGDWFDKSHNDEATLLRASALATPLGILIGGNHDLDNNHDSVTSLGLLRVTGNKRAIRFPAFGEAHFDKAYYADEGLTLYTVAHHATQDLFEQGLEAACNDSKAHNGPKMLLLHCNYDSPFATHETTLNITEDDADYLLEHFDYVMLGHEHQPRDLFGGRLIVLGNTHPTSFADISEKRVAVWENSELRFERIWNPKGRYLKLHHSQLVDTDFSTAEFVHVHGEVEPGEVLAITREARRVTKEATNLFMLRLDLDTKALDRVQRNAGQHKLTLPQRIELALESDPDSLALWRELQQEA